jgi:hypothetical protein
MKGRMRRYESSKGKTCRKGAKIWQQLQGGGILAIPEWGK